VNEAAEAPWSGLRVALVHDWLTGMRGGEKVLEALCRIFPAADLFTLVHVPGSVSPLIEQRRIRTSFIQHLPRAGRLYRQYLPLFPWAVEGLNLDAYDLVVSSSHCAAKSVIVPAGARHVCYCHTPMRYVWDQFDAYFGPERIGAAASAAARPVMSWLARWDRATAARVHRFVANSRHVAGRIARYYNRPATVLYAPVDTKFFSVGADTPEDWFLVVSALVPYKRIDIAVAAARRAGVRVKIVGTGPDEARLRAGASPHAEFLGAVDDATLRDLYRRAAALVLPGEEDFGIAPVEALACGTPVVALGRGGACETIEDGVTGRLVPEATADAFADAMRDVASRRFVRADLRARAEPFSAERFDAGFRAILQETLTANAAW